MTEKWNWYYEKPVRVPLISNIRLKYISDKICCENLLSYNDYNFTDLSSVNKNSFNNRKDDIKKDYFNIMQIDNNKNPVCYLGFTNKFANGRNSVYFKLLKKKYHTSFRNFSPAANENLILRWEYWNGKKWYKLDVNSLNNNFNESGFVEFASCDDLKSKPEFGMELYWIRVIFESGSFELNPEIFNIHLNSVYAYNHEIHFNELLGSGNGMPGQKFTFINKPVLSQIEIAVMENECLLPLKKSK